MFLEAERSFEDVGLEATLDTTPFTSVEYVRDCEFDGVLSPCVLDCVVLMIKFDEMLEGIPPEAFPTTSVDAERKDATLDAVGEEV